MTALYRQPGLILGRGTNVPAPIVQELQRDLRRLGYLRAGVDGKFGGGTEVAVRALQADLLANDGGGSDGRAPVALRDFNRGRVAVVTGLRPCRFAPADPRFLRDRRTCAREAPHVSLAPADPLYPGSSEYLVPTQYHPEQRYDDLPDRKALGCDWPYAVRRYNGGGVNSYHYQAQVLIRLDRDRVLSELFPTAEG